jgi:hypothetical protein
MNLPDEKPEQSTELQTYSAGTGSLILDANSFDRIMQFADMMARGVATVPKHLQKSPSDCAAVVMQAMQWGMNPYAVAQKTHIVNGALGYEAQLVNAVICASGLITGRFHYEYKGTSPALECRVGAIPKGESEVVWSPWICENKITTKNSPLWKTNVQQQMGYLQVKNWARQYCPGAILGVYTNDELEDSPVKDVTPIDKYVTEFQAKSIECALGKKTPQAVARFKAAYGEPDKVLKSQYNEVMAKLQQTKDAEPAQEGVYMPADKQAQGEENGFFADCPPNDMDKA